VVVAPPGKQFEICSKLIGKTLGIVSADRQSAAFFRAVLCKRPDDDVTAASNRLFRAGDVGGAIGWVDQKMKRRAVMPDVEGLRRTPFGDISRDPLHKGRPIAKPLFRNLERGPGNVEHADMQEPARDEVIDKTRRPASDIDDRRLRRRSCEAISSMESAGLSSNQLTSFSARVA